MYKMGGNVAQKWFWPFARKNTKFNWINLLRNIPEQKAGYLNARDLQTHLLEHRTSTNGKPESRLEPWRCNLEWRRPRHGTLSCRAKPPMIMSPPGKINFNTFSSEDVAQLLKLSALNIRSYWLDRLFGHSTKLYQLYRYCWYLIACYINLCAWAFDYRINERQG